MIEKSVDFEGHQYVKGKIIKGNSYIYVEYRNNELGKIKFFEVDDGNIKEVTDKEDLKQAIEKNYIIKTNI